MRVSQTPLVHVQDGGASGGGLSSEDQKGYQGERVKTLLLKHSHLRLELQLGPRLVQYLWCPGFDP